jgi:hypothetical protein
MRREPQVGHHNRVQEPARAHRLAIFSAVAEMPTGQTDGRPSRCAGTGAPEGGSSLYDNLSHAPGQSRARIALDVWPRSWSWRSNRVIASAAGRRAITGDNCELAGRELATQAGISGRRAST